MKVREQFLCDGCLERLPLPQWCPETASAVVLLCVACCTCERHETEVEGQAVFAGTPLTWRGLGDTRLAPRV